MTNVKQDAASIHSATARLTECVKDLLDKNQELAKLVERAYLEGFADGTTWQVLRAQSLTLEEFSEEAGSSLWEESLSCNRLTEMLA